MKVSICGSQGQMSQELASGLWISVDCDLVPRNAWIFERKESAPQDLSDECRLVNVAFARSFNSPRSVRSPLAVCNHGRV
jgi:hypothetical protein